MKHKVVILKTLSAICGLVLTAGLAHAQAPTEFGFSKTRPRLVILLHGVTPEPLQDPDARIGQSGHARHYWGFDFIKGLQGRLDETEMRVITPKVGGTLRFKRTVKADWVPTTTDSSVWDYAPICFPVSWMTALPPNIENDQKLMRDHIRLLTKASGANTTMVMVNTRNGSKHLMPQVGETIDEIYMSYTVAFGDLPEAQQPQIYLVGHSFGGVIARAILANPAGGDLWGNKLTINQRLRADYLRRRVVLVQTLASPHEGTIVQDPSSDIADYIAKYGYAQILSAINTYNFFARKGMTADQMRAKARDFVKLALDNVAGKRDCLADLTRMGEYNSGILKASTARRAEGGTLVPIYTSAGRNPGGTYFDQSRSVFFLGGYQWNPVSTIDLLQGTRAAKEASALNLIQSLFHLEGYGRKGKMPWGQAEIAAGDRVAAPFQGVGPSTARSVSTPWFPTSATIKGVVDALLKGAPYTFGKSDGQWDSDGFLAWDSAHALHLPAINFYRVYDPAKYGGMLPWDNDNHGSIMFNPGNGAWIHNELIREAGPFVYLGARRSVWNNTDVPKTPSNGIKVEVLEVKDTDNQLDTVTQADFSLNLRVGATEQTINLKDNTQTVTGIPAFNLTNFAGTVIPIRIAVTERDTPDPNDLCVVSPTKGQSSMFLYFDTRTNRIFGDLNGNAGEILNSNWIWWNTDARVYLKVRITRL
jgi:hypothetical protein